MNIGIDIDNVISNFNDVLLERFLEHDKKLRNKGIIDNTKYINRGMFDWSQEETKYFYDSIIEDVAVNLDLIRDAKKYIDKLKADGHDIYIITGRDNGEYSDPHKLTENWLNEKEVKYDKLLLTDSRNHDKYIKCVEYNIDILLDDSYSMCVSAYKNLINVVLMNTPFNNYNDNLKRVNNFKEFYDYVKTFKKYEVILDTDIFNECDDQFALAYLMKSKNIFDIKAITVAPYQNKLCDIQTGIKNSINEIHKVGDLIGYDLRTKTFSGSYKYLEEDDYIISEASKKIIDIALSNEITYIIAIGALTNVASAIVMNPNIIDRIEVIWLGGHALDYKDNLEFNFRQDIKAVKTVFGSKVKLTILPCEGVVRKLEITIDELKQNLIKNNLNTYLMQRFSNDGYHGEQYKRPIWDISAIAYLINKNWFKIEKINCPEINDDTTYTVNTSNHIINYVSDLNRELIYNNLFEKLNKNNKVESNNE